MAAAAAAVAASSSPPLHTKAPHVPLPGVWVPAITFFHPHTDAVDLASQERYFSHLSRSGLTGLVILGTNAEAALLTRHERTALLSLARAAVPPGFPLMAGCSGNSTAQVLENIADAAACGADYALVLPCAYLGARASAQEGVVEGFYCEVAGRSGLPVVVYNFPGVCNGVDVDSEMIVRMVRRSREEEEAAEGGRGKGSNIVGVKLTCGSVGKITRLSATLSPSEFAIFGGQSDFLIGGLAAGSAGCVAAFGNVFPKSIVAMYRLWMEGRYEEARKLQGKAALAESPVKAGVAAVKFASAAVGAARAAGIEDVESKVQPRRPYLGLGGEAKEKIRSVMAEMMEVEAGL